MSHNSRPSTGKGVWTGRLPVRTLAILLMVAGAAGFVFARLAFGDQVLCLFASTLVTFIGLAMVFIARRSGMDGQQQSPDQQTEVGSQPMSGGKIPPGLWSSTGRPTPIPPPTRATSLTDSTVEPVEPTASPAQPASPLIEPGAAWVPADPETLLDEVVAVLEEQGAQVEIESQRESEGENRGILRVHARDGKNYAVLVRDAGGEVDVSEVRALSALVSSSGSASGILVSSAPFTQRAYDWASARGIRLVREDELGEVSI